MTNQNTDADSNTNTTTATLSDRVQRSIRGLYDALENSTLYPQNVVENALNAAFPSLRLALDAFGTPSKVSRTKVSSGNVKREIVPTGPMGKTVPLSNREKGAALTLSDLVGIDEVESALIVHNYYLETNRGLSVAERDGTGLTDDDVKDLLLYYFAERSAILNSLCSILRMCEDEKSRFHQETETFMTKLLKEEHGFVDRIIAQIKSKSAETIPQQFQTSNRRAELWTKQNIEELLGLMELLFLLFYKRAPCPPKLVVEMMSFFKSTHFFQLQMNSAYFDADTVEHAKQLSHLAIITAIEILNLEELPDDLQLLETPPERAIHIWESPKDVLKLNDIVATMENSEAYGPILLAWACILCQLAAALSNPGYPSSFEILKSIQFTGVAGDSIETFDEYGHRAFRLRVLDYIYRVLQGGCFRSSSPNVLGYKGIVKGLLLGFVVSFRVNNIPNFDKLIDCMALLFEGQPELCEQYWNHDCLSSSRRSLLDTARARFPSSFHPLIRLVTSLSQNATTATFAFQYLRNLPTFTHQLSSSEIQEYVESGRTSDGPIVLAKKDFHLPPKRAARPLIIPKGTVGKILSPKGEIIQWQHPYSVWRLLSAVLDAYINPTTLGKKAFDSSVVTNAIELVNAIFVHEPRCAQLLVQETIPTGNALNPWEPQSDIISQIFAILNQTLLELQPDENLIKTSLQFIASAVSIFPQEIWTSLKQVALIPRSAKKCHTRGTAEATTSLQYLQQSLESLKGRYGITIAFLNLVAALLEDALKVTPPEQMGMREKAEILIPCMGYIQHDIFPLFNHWRYTNVLERFQIGSKILALFNRIMRDSSLQTSNTSARTQQRTPGLEVLYEQLVSTFLYDGGIYQICPLLQILGNGRNLGAELRRQQKRVEAEEVELLLVRGLTFVRSLLKVRKLSPERGSTLEHVLLDRSVGKDDAEIVSILVSHIAEANVAVSAIAAEVLTLLCSIASEWEPRPPSFIGYFGSQPEAVDMVTSFVHILNDEEQPPELHVALLHFVSVAIGTQPGLASLFLKGKFPGRSPRMGNGASLTTTGTAKKPDETLLSSNSVIHPVLFFIQNWSYDVSPSALRLLRAVWENRPNYHDVIDYLHKQPKLWETMRLLLVKKTKERCFESAVDVSFSGESGVITQISDDVKEVCALYISKGHVLNILANEIQSTIVREISGTRKGGEFQFPKPVAQLIKAMVHEGSQFFEVSLNTSYDHELYENFYQCAKELPLELDLRSMKTRAWSDDYDTGRRHGDAFIFDVDLMKMKLDPDTALCVRTSNEMNYEAESPILKLLIIACRVNHNLSLADAQNVLLKSWTNFLEAASSSFAEDLWKDVEGIKKNDAHAVEVLFPFISAAARSLAKETRTAAVVVTVRTQVAALLAHLMEKLSIMVHGAKEAKMPGKEGVELLALVQQAIQSESFTIVDSAHAKLAYEFHVSLFSAILLVLRELHQTTIESVDTETKIALRQTCQFLLATFSGAATSMLDSLTAKFTPETVRDLDLMISLLAELINPTFNPHASLWLTQFQRHNLLQSLLVGFSTAVSVSQQETPVIAESILHFFLKLANIPMAAERLATSGLVAVFSNNSLSPSLQKGGIPVLSHMNAMERNPWHTVWCLMLAILSSMLCHLQESEQFVAHVLGFSALYRCQLFKALEVDQSQSLSSAHLEEIERVTMMFYRLSNLTEFRSSSGSLYSGTDRKWNIEGLDMEQEYEDRCLLIFRWYTYLFFHQAHMESCLLPLDRKERGQLQLADEPSAVNGPPVAKKTESTMATSAPKSTLSLAGNPLVLGKSINDYYATTVTASPFMASIKQKMVLVIRNILSSLVNLTDAASIISKPAAEWTHSPIFAPTLRVSMIEPASIGTLIDCIHFSNDLVKASLSKKSTSQKRSATTKSSSNLQAASTPLANSVTASERAESDVDLDGGALVGLEIIEASFLLAGTQLAMLAHMEGLDYRTRQEVRTEYASEILVSMEKVHKNITEASRRVSGDKTPRFDVVPPLTKFVRTNILLSE